MTNEKPQSEHAIIQGYFAPLAEGYAGAYGLQDDCATITPPPGMDVVVKTDPIRAGVHFFADDSPADIAWKALAVNVSDLAAKGAEPLAYLLAVSFPEAPQRDWIKGFAGGLQEAQSAFGMHLIGGDTDRAEGPMTFAVTVFGLVPAGKMVRRGTARPGDKLFVTGTLGDSALGLTLRRGDGGGWPLSPAERDGLLHRYLRPMPRLALRAALRCFATAAMDISDGLVKDCERMARASGTGAVIRADALPASPAVARLMSARPQLLKACLAGGDDYEILCNVPEGSVPAFAAAASKAGIPVTCIGEITPGKDVIVIDALGEQMQLDRGGWDHF